MLVLRKADIKQIYSMREAIDAAKMALSLHAAGGAVVPLRTNLSLPAQEAQCLFMPAYAAELASVGLKVVSVFPHNQAAGKAVVQAQMLLLDGHTGEVVALLDGTYLTQLRTGALQGAASDTLARPDAKEALLIGTGGQAAAQLEALLAVRKLDEVKVVGRERGRTEAFVEAMRQEFKHTATKITAHEDANTAAGTVDIITAITNSHEPVFDGRLVRPGTHINGMGAYLPTMQELPANALQRASLVTFDSQEGVLAEAGDVRQALASGQIPQAALVGELGKILRGEAKGRQAASDITVFKSVGMAILDLVTAYQIYQKALTLGVGQSLTL